MKMDSVEHKRQIVIQNKKTESDTPLKETKKTDLIDLSENAKMSTDRIFADKSVTKHEKDLYLLLTQCVDQIE